jgi:peroxiredoxin
MAHLEVVMPVQTEHRFPLDLSVLDAAGSRVTLADLRGQARAVAVYFMRTGTCPVCIQHARALARLDLPTHGVQPVVVVPGSPTHAARVRRILGDRVTVVSSAWRPPCPPAASTAQRCRPRSTGRNAPTILPQRAAKG